GATRMAHHDDLTTDVLVVGAGASGLPAAIAAARAGAKVTLIEEDPVIGGAPSDYYVCLFYGAPITGVLKELEDLLKAKYSPVPGAQFFLPSGFQRAWAELLSREPNIQLITGARATDVRIEDRKGKSSVTGISVEVMPGRHFAIDSKVTIDCTGSGIVSIMAGCTAMYGRDAKADFGEPNAPEKSDDRVQAVTWMYFIQKLPGAKPLPAGRKVGVSVNTGIRPRGHLGPWPSEEAESAPDPGLYLQWGCAVRCRDTRDPVELSRAHQEAYKAMEGDHALLRENGYMIYLAPRIGVREASRILGEHVITENDITHSVFPDDTIAVADYGFDDWRPHRVSEECGNVDEFGAATARYGIPYRALIPQGVDGILVAGKCMSGTHIAQSSFRVMPIVASAGQAAGVAAALSAKYNLQPRALDPEEIRALLRTQPQHLQLSFDEA
ncbi:MAG: FAD-dependent oxidoreductase, partial [Armatimonadota bacterium]